MIARRERFLRAILFRDSFSRLHLGNGAAIRRSSVSRLVRLYLKIGNRWQKSQQACLDKN